MKRSKKVLKITGITFLVLILISILIPVLFKNQITSLVKNEINKSLDAKVDFATVSLSLFRHFPKISIRLKDLSITGLHEFEGDTLFYAEKTDASANLWSVLRGKNIKVAGLFITSPRVNLLVNKDGKENWDIAKKTIGPDDDTTASEFRMSLKIYKISNGHIVYRDEYRDIYMNLEEVDHTGSGNLTQDVFILRTVTKAEAASYTQSKIPYLVNTKTFVETDIKIDNSTNTYTFKTDDIILNNLKLSADGFLQLANDSTYNMDIRFNSASNEFKDILSLIPAMYKKDFDKLKTGGNAVFAGFVKGTYSPQQFPAYDINVEVKDGSFRYPDLPKQVQNIQFALHAVNPDGKPDHAVFDLSKGYLEMDNEPFDFRFLFKNPETVKYVDAAIKGKLDLSQLSQFIKLDEGTTLSGLVHADAYAKGSLGTVDNPKGGFSAGGFFDISNLFYSAKIFPQPIQHGNMKVQLQNNDGIADKTIINITAGHVEMGNDPVDFSLQVSRPVSSVNFDGSAKGKLTLENIKQYLSLEPGASLTGMLHADIKFAGNKTMIDKGEYDKIRLAGEANLNQFKYVSKDYPSGISITSLLANLNASNFIISSLSGNYMNSNFSGNATLKNLVGFAVNNDPLKGTLNVTVDTMNLNDWMGTPDASQVSKTATPQPANSNPFLVPANLDLQLNVKAGKITYDNVDYNNVNGTVFIENESVKFQNLKAEALDGTAVINGSYSTKSDKNKPGISIHGSVKNMSAQKVFHAYNSIKAIMPIGKFIDGKLNSDLTMTGSLAGDMMPVLNSLSGNGNLLLLEGVLRKFAPLEMLANRLQIDRLKDITVKDIKNYFEFSNGKVLVKPFRLKVEDIEMQIGGMHGIDQSLDYFIAMKVPRHYLGKEGNNLINSLVSSAAGKGIPVNVGEVVNLNVKMEGSITSPVLKINLEQVAGNVAEELKQQAEDFIKAKADSAKQRVKDTLTSIKEQVKDELKDKLKEQLFGKDTLKKETNPADTGQKKTGDIIKDKLKGLLNRDKKPASDTQKNQ
jgi:hypothetical protein